MLTCRVALLVLLVPGLLAVARAQVHPLRQVRFGQHQTYSRIVLDLRQRVPYRVVQGAAPDKIRLEFPGMRQLPSQVVWQSENSLIRTVRFVAGASNVRAELSLQRPGRLRRHFRLDAPHRVVVDIISLPASTTTPPPRLRTQANDKPKPQGARRALADARTPPQSLSTPAPPTTPQPTARTLALSRPLSERQLLKRAEREWAAQDYTSAQLSYETFLAQSPEHRRNHLIATRLADILRKQEKYREALDAYADVMVTYPGTEGALVSQIRMAELRVEAPDLSPAAKAGEEGRYAGYTSPVPTLQQLIRDFPLHSLAKVARYTIGAVLLERDQLPGALGTFRELLERSLTATLRHATQDKLREVVQRLAAAQVKQGEFLPALRTFFKHKALLAPADMVHPDLLLSVAASYAGLGLLDEAAHFYQMLLEADDLTPANRVELTLNRASVLLRNGQRAEAQAHLTPVQQFPEGAMRHRALRMLGDIALQEGQPAVAARYLQPVETLFPSGGQQAQILARLARAYEAQGEIAPALQALQGCVKRATQEVASPLPLAEECLLQSGALHVAQQQYPPALAVYQSALQLFPRSRHRDWILFRTAEIYRQMEDEPHMLESLQTLQANARSPFWKRVATEYTNDQSWRQRFHERLAQFHDAGGR